MSKLAKNLRDLAFKGIQGGSPDTRYERSLHVQRFAQFLQDKNIQIRTVDQIKSSHIESYISSQISVGKSKRSLQNCQSASKIDHPTASNFDQGIRLISCVV